MTIIYRGAEDNIKTPVGYWWKCTGKKLCDTMFSTSDALRNEQVHIKSRYKKAIKLYENVDCEDLDAWRFMTNVNVDGPNQDNIVESIIDTIHAEIIANKTKCQFVTFGGNYEAEEKAKDLTTFTAGIFRENKVNSVLAPAIALDAMQFGDGWAKVYLDPENNRIKCCRVFPWNIIVDDVEAANSPPTCMYESTLISRELMRQYYEDDKELLFLIDSCQEHRFKLRQTSGLSDMLEVREAWYIGTEKNPGKHVICLRNGVLLEEQYLKNYFPFINLKFKTRSKGFLGKGIPEILEGHQERINSFSEKIDAQIQANAPFVWVPPNTGIKEAHLSNKIFRFVESEAPPQVINPTSVPQDLLARETQIIQNAASRVGVNALMMQSEVPSGLAGGSGRQLRIYNDTKSKRFMKFADQYEQFHIELAEVMIDAVNETVNDLKTSYKINAEADGALEEIDFRDIRLPPNSFIIRPYPINFLSETPAGRISDIQMLYEISPEEMKPHIMGLLQNPDVESITSMLTAQQRNIVKTLTSLIRDDDIRPIDVAPNYYMDLNLAVKLAQNMVIDLKSRNAPDVKIQKVIDWLETAKILIDNLRRKEEQEMMQQQMQAASAAQTIVQ